MCENPSIVAMRLSHMAVPKFAIIGNSIKRFALMQTWQHRNGHITAAQFLSVHQDDTAILLNASHDVGYWAQTLEDPSEYEWYVNWETYDQ